MYDCDFSKPSAGSFIAGSMSAAKGSEGLVFSWQPKDWSGDCPAVIPRVRDTLDLGMKGQRK